MRTAVTILFFIFCSGFSFGQVLSLTIDSLSKSYISRLSADKQTKFENILKHRLTVNLFRRIDTTSFDYAFIKESFCYSDTSGTVSERYFKATDSIPHSVYHNGKFTDPKITYDGFLIWHSKNVMYNYTLHPLIKSYSKFKPVQKVSYDKRQIWMHGCVVNENSKANFKKRRTDELKSTYQVMTMIDKVNNRIVVSVQFAPTSPGFKTYSYNPVWDF